MMNTSRSLITMMLIIALVPMTLVGCGDSDAVNAQNDEDVAIRVNDEVITQSEFEERLQMQLQPILQRFDAESMDDLPPRVQAMEARFKRRIANQSTSQLVLLSHAKQSDISVSDAEIEEKWNSLKDRFPSEEQFQQQVEQMGQSEEQIKSDIHDSILIEKFIEREVGEMSVSEQEMRDYFDENKDQYGQGERIRARHILLESDTQAESDIRSIKEQLDDGASFEEMAEEYSEGPSASEGGSLGTFERGKMVPAFDEVAFGLQPGVVSDPVETRFGYHLIKVEEKLDSEPADFEAHREDIRQTLENQRRQSKAQELVQRLKEQSDIENNVDIPEPQQGMQAPRGGGQPGAGSPQGGQQQRRGQ